MDASCRPKPMLLPVNTGGNGGPTIRCPAAPFGTAPFETVQMVRATLHISLRASRGQGHLIKQRTSAPGVPTRLSRRTRVTPERWTGCPISRAYPCARPSGTRGKRTGLVGCGGAFDRLAALVGERGLPRCIAAAGVVIASVGAVPHPGLRPLPLGIGGYIASCPPPRTR